MPHWHALRLHSTWQISLEETMRFGRKRLMEEMELEAGHHRTGSRTMLRFNDTFIDERSCFRHLVVGPRSKVQFCWACLATILIVWDIMTLPLELFPIHNFVRIVDAMAIASWIFWLIDIPLHLVFGVQVAGTNELRPAVLWSLYLRSWFMVDFLVVAIDAIVIALDGFQAGSVSSPMFRSARLIRALRMVRLVRLIRVARLERTLTLLANRFLSTYSFMVMKVMGYLLLLLAVNHVTACCWYGIGVWSGDRNWMQRLEIEETNFLDSYVSAMHWALTQFTPSTNNIAPDNPWERFFAIWVILLAMGVFSSFIASISSTVNSMRLARAEEIKQKADLRQFFMDRNLSVELFGKVQGVLAKEGLFEVRKLESQVQLVETIPERYKVQLHREMYMSSLTKLGIWPKWGHKEDAQFLLTVCHHGMKEHVSMLGQDVFMPGRDCREVYIIDSGSLEYSASGEMPFECTAASATDSVLCLPALWAEWTHRGRLTANYGLCYYNGIDCEQFCSLAINFGGVLCHYLKILGILLVGAIEALDEEAIHVTDISLQTHVPLSGIVLRATQFASIQTTATALKQLRETPKTKHRL
ncbi:CNGA1, partial [Symbiodinium microadriaticum]